MCTIRRRLPGFLYISTNSSSSRFVLIVSVLPGVPFLCLLLCTWCVCLSSQTQRIYLPEVSTS